MSWKLLYHAKVAEDLQALGAAEAANVMQVIDSRIRHGEPDKLGKPLRGSLAGYRRVRTGNIRIIYRVHVETNEVFIMAAGPRRNDEVYASAKKRS